MSSMNGWASVPTGTGANGPAARRRRRGIAGAAITALVAAGLAAGTVTPAQAALIGPVGVIGVDGFPASFSDGNITLEQCLDTVQCLANIELPVPDTPASFPDNYPIEQFWFAASAATPTQIGLYEAALEGAYANDVVTAGDEVSFGRIRVILNAVVPGATYRVQHPYGEFTVTDGDALDERAPAGEIRVTDDLGCVAANIPCGAAGFATAAASFLGNSVNPTSHFLTQNNPVAPTVADPRIRIGDLLVAGPVGGAPNVDALGQPINRVIVTGPNINPGAPNVNGPNVNTLIQDQFNVQGILAGEAVAPSAVMAPAVVTGPVPVVSWQAPANGGSPVTEYSVQAVNPVTGAPVGAALPATPVVGTSAMSLPFPGLTAGTKVAFQVTATNAIGPSVAVPVRSAAVIPGTQTQRYVGNVYSDLFNRAPDPAGMGFWTARLDSGTPRVAVANSITSSTEYRTKLITASYSRYLDRLPDAGGLNVHLAAMNRGITISQMESGFIASSEYFIKAGSTNEGLVTAMYSDVLGRTASPADVSFWTGRLNAGVSRSQVAMGFLLSTERLTTVVTEYYVQLLGRGLDPSGQATWVRILQAGGRNEAIIGSIIASPEYFAKI